MIPSFTLAEPGSLAEAASCLAELGREARCYAGGVRLLLDIREGRDAPGVLVNLKRVPELTSVGWKGDRLRLGACVTHTAVAAAGAEDPRLRVLAEMASAVGNVRVRNMGTLGGNLAVADPHADPATALLLLDAEVEVFGPGGDRMVPLAQFHAAPFTPDLREAEFIAAVHVRPLPAGAGSAYERVQRLLPPTLTVAAATEMTGTVLRNVRLSIGSVGPVALRLTELEAELDGKQLADALARIGERAAYVTGMTTPVSDLWGSAEYKSYMSIVLLQRALAAAAGRAEEASSR